MFFYLDNSILQNRSSFKGFSNVEIYQSIENPLYQTFWELIANMWVIWIQKKSMNSQYLILKIK
jgi:hypothetical protein